MMDGEWLNSAFRRCMDRGKLYPACRLSACKNVTTKRLMNKGINTLSNRVHPVQRNIFVQMICLPILRDLYEVGVAYS